MSPDPIPPLADQLLEAWRTNNRINLFLVDRIKDEGLRCTLSTRGGRSVGRQLAHLHNQRVWHLEARARDLATGLYKFKTEEEPGRDELKAALTASSGRIETFIADVIAGVPKRRPFKKGIVATVAYLIAHDSHHRGSILLTLKTSGHKLDQRSAYAIWDWDRI